MLCYPMEERRLLDPKFGWDFPRLPVIVQPKLDGERCHPIGNILPEIELISSECNPIISVPRIKYALAEQKISIEVDGELYIHGMDFSDIHSIVSRKSEETIHDQAHKMQYHIFDIITTDSQLKRISQLEDMILEHPLYHVPYRICSTFEEILEVYNEYLSYEYEGIIIRHIHNIYQRKRSNKILKFKPKKTDSYTIISVNQAIDKNGSPKPTMGSFTCVGSDETKFNVGAGILKHGEREYYWHHPEDAIGKECIVQYQSLTSLNGVPRFGLALEVI